MSGGYVVDVDPRLVEVAYELTRLMESAALVSKLGVEWRVTVERNGRPAAEIRRTRDHGLSVGFYGDDPAAVPGKRV